MIIGNLLLKRYMGIDIPSLEEAIKELREINSPNTIYDNYKSTNAIKDKHGETFKLFKDIATFGAEIPIEVTIFKSDVKNPEFIRGRSVIFILNVTELLSHCIDLRNQGKIRYTYTNNTSMNGVVHIDIGGIR